MDPIKEFRRKRREAEFGKSSRPEAVQPRDHRDRLTHEIRSAGDEVSRPSNAVPSRAHWASSPRFIKSGSLIFDEVFRIGMGFPAGMSLGFAVLDLRRLASEQLQVEGTSLAAIGGLAGFFALGAFFIAPVVIIWGLVRQAQLKAIRKRKEPAPDPIHWLGLPALAVGFACYLFVRTL